MTNRFRIFGVIILFCVAASCSRVPKHILSEKKMRTVLYDMQLAEGLVETQNESYQTSEERKSAYNAVFAKHHITQAEYDSSLVWYGKNMDLYMRIYRLVLKDINQSITALGDVKPNPLSGEVSAKDSVDIWIYNRSFTFVPSEIFNTLTFSIEPKVPYSAGSSYVFGMSVWGIRPEEKHKPILHISAVHQDTIVSVNQEISGDGYYETILRTVANKPVKRVYGYILMNNAEATYRRIYLDGIQFMKYNLGSTALTAPPADSIPPLADAPSSETIKKMPAKK